MVVHMKFGMNLLLWSGELNDGMLPVVERLKKIGYDGVEVPIFGGEPATFRPWSRRLDDFGFERTAVTIRTDADNPISADAKIRAAGVEATKRTLDCCHELGVETLCGPYHSAIGLFSGKGPTQDEWKWGVESMRQVAEHAKSAGVMLAVEYLNRFETYFLTCAADTVRFIKEVEPSQLPHDVRHVSREHRGERYRRRDSHRRSSHGARTYF